MNGVIGIDVGGANLKYAALDGAADHRSFPMWRYADQLSETVAADLQPFLSGPSTALAVTMTGELADCFLDRGEGVAHIVQQLAAAARTLPVSTVTFYGVDGQFHHAQQAIANPDLVAAANWHALAHFVARELAREAVLIDVGSTTTDVVPIAAGKVATDARTDFDRLQERSLVYVGCQRTPVGCLCDRLQFRHCDVPVMNEWFATIDDARILTGSEPEHPDDLDSADGKPRTQFHAANRMARMIGLDHRAVGIEPAQQLARQVVAAAKHRISEAISVWTPATSGDQSRFVLSGHGQDLVDVPRSGNVMQLTDQLGPKASRCAPAYAVARLFQSTLP